MSFPLLALDSSRIYEPTGVKRPFSNRIDSLLSALREASERNHQDGLVYLAQRIDSEKDLTEEDTKILADAINRKGIKLLTHHFLTTENGKFSKYITEEQLYRNATRAWWSPNRKLPDTPMLNFEVELDGSVVVDLWHSKRSQRVPTDSFSEFATSKPTFFMGSRGEVDEHIDSIRDYVGEGESDQEGIYVKRGRFRFKPLLWFNDKSARTLIDGLTYPENHPMRDKSEVVAQLVNAHPAFQNGEFDLRQKNENVWKRMLYMKTHVEYWKKDLRELRLDNNCVSPADIPLSKGFKGTLAIDVSGMGAAVGEPGMGEIDTKSIVLWDVPGTLVNESHWERVEE